MTREEFTRELPDLTNNPLPLKPPFVFNGLSGRIFPLRASLDALQELCNGYLNLVPPEAGRFRPVGPYVLLMLLDYGQLSEAVTRIGWFAQIEVFFGVPVEWYKVVNGNYVFHDWAVITPYIFVNDAMSVPLGRSVYGFPKSLAKVTQADGDWIKNCLGPVKLLQVQTAVFPEAYAGRKLDWKTFLEVERQPPINNLRVPPDFAGPMAPWTIAGNLAQAMGGFGRDAMRMAQALRIFPLGPAAFPSIMQQMGQRLAAGIPPWGQGLIQNSLNLKQFRRSDDPSYICYQSLTNGRMVGAALNGGGLLGEDRVMLGDLSGGHSVRLYEHSSLPIARILGLEVAQSWRSEDINVAELKPVMPFWINVDVQYEQGINVAWRSHYGIWKDASGAPYDPDAKPAPEDDGPLFNVSVASAIEAVSGPFEFTGTTIRVLPLLAQKEKLQKFLDDYINRAFEGPENPIVGDGNEPGQNIRLRVWARPPIAVNSGLPVGGEFAYVYLTASSFEGVTSKSNNVGDWAKYELAFMIPVKFERQLKDGTWETAGVGMVPGVHMVDTCVAAISRFEIQGINSMTATFVRPESVWLGETHGDFRVDPAQTLLRVDAEVFPAVEAGQETALHPVLEIRRHDLNDGLGPEDSRDSRWQWAENLRLELGTKKSTKAMHPEAVRVARALALELLGNRTPFAIYSLKQFRDITEPDKACYQSLVRVPRSFREVLDLREIEETLVVKIQDYPTLKIVETLGLVATKLPDSATGITYSVQAVRPFFIRATVDEALSERLAARAGTNQWSIHTEACFATLLSDDPGAPPITADYQAETLQDQMDPCRMSSIMYQAAQRLRFDEARRAIEKTPAITKAAARNALDLVDPQLVIDSILSREWGNTDENTRWRRGRRELQKATAALPVAGPAKAFAEAVLYRKINNALAAPPGAVASALPNVDQDTKDVEKVIREVSKRPPNESAVLRWWYELQSIILSQEKFERLRVKMEEKVNVLAAYEILGPRGMREAYKGYGEAGGAKPDSGNDSPSTLAKNLTNPSAGEPLNHQQLAEQVTAAIQRNAPTRADIIATGAELIRILKEISEQKIQGEPSERNNLDTEVLADKMRLSELLKEIPTWKTEDEILEGALAHGEQFRQMVELARSFCDAQTEALRNKLSRAYQKPDFCIRRDAVGQEKDRLLPLSLSWDEDWYYGDEIEYLLMTPKLSKPATPKPNRVGDRGGEGPNAQA